MEYNAFMGGLDKGTLQQIREKFPDFASSFNPNQNQFQTFTVNPYLKW